MNRRAFIGKFKFLASYFMLSSIPILRQPKVSGLQFYFYLSMQHPEGNLTSEFSQAVNTDDIDWIKNLNQRFKENGRLVSLEHFKTEFKEEWFYVFATKSDFEDWEKQILEHQKFAIHNAPRSLTTRTASGYLSQFLGKLG